MTHQAEPENSATPANDTRPANDTESMNRTESATRAGSTAGTDPRHQPDPAHRPDPGHRPDPADNGRSKRRTALTGAMFLMATSAIGPGFITQTTVFTAELGAAFAFAILVSVLIDLAVQLNVWRIIGVAGRYAHTLANAVLPGAGHVLAALVVFGGLVFNIGNIGGTGLGTDALLGVDPKIGGAASALIAIAIFVSRRAGVAMDRIVVVLGIVMIAMTLYVSIVSGPPAGEALRQAVLPDRIDFLAITTLVGGTVGGYITYSGAHRLVDAGVTGRERVTEISRGAVTGILVTAVMRVLLFLAVLGVVAAGVSLADDNPAASAFQNAAGTVGLRVFGLVLWAASITSVIGASYTSVSFLSTASERVNRARGPLVIAFIAISAAGYLALGKAPVTLLILAGALNGLILPVGVGVLLWVAVRRSHDLLGGYRYPRRLVAVGALGWLLTVYVGWESLTGIAELWK